MRTSSPWIRSMGGLPVERCRSEAFCSFMNLKKESIWAIGTQTRADLVPRYLPVLVFLFGFAVSSLAEPLWVAVGYGGRRLSSRDGQTWENDQRWSDEAKDDDHVLFNVAYGRASADTEGRFIAVGG